MCNFLKHIERYHYVALIYTANIKIIVITAYASICLLFVFVRLKCKFVEDWINWVLLLLFLDLLKERAVVESNFDWLKVLKFRMDIRNVLRAKTTVNDGGKQTITSPKIQPFRKTQGSTQKRETHGNNFILFMGNKGDGCVCVYTFVKPHPIPYYHICFFLFFSCCLEVQKQMCTFEYI